jgi:hypothetical protein
MKPHIYFKNQLPVLTRHGQQENKAVLGFEILSKRSKQFLSRTPSTHASAGAANNHE